MEFIYFHFDSSQSVNHATSQLDFASPFSTIITLCNTKFVYCIFFIDLDEFFAADFENAVIFSLSSVLF